VPSGMPSRKSVLRKLKSRLHAAPVSIEVAFDVAKLAATLIPEWLSSRHRHFHEFLVEECRLQPQFAVKVETLGLSYREVPSLAIWKALGLNKVRGAIDLDQDAKADKLLSDGASPLDVMLLE